MSDPTWLADLILDCKKGNWEEWSSQITILAKQQGFLPWLNGSFLAPLEADNAACHFTWNSNNASLRGFIEQYICVANRNDISSLNSTVEVFNFLRICYVALGSWLLGPM
jgi:hypothetical protein